MSTWWVITITVVTFFVGVTLGYNAGFRRGEIHGAKKRDGGNKNEGGVNEKTKR